MEEIVFQLERIGDFIEMLVLFNALQWAAIFGILVFKDCHGSSTKGIENEIKNLKETIRNKYIQKE